MSATPRDPRLARDPRSIEPGWLSTRDVAGASALNLGALLVQGILFLVLTPLTYRALGPAKFGGWTLMVAVQATAAVGTFGVGPALVKLVAQQRANIDSEARIAATIGVAARVLLGAGVALGTLLWFLREPLARTIGRSDLGPSFAAGIGAIAIGLPALTVGLGIRSVLSGFFLNRAAIGVDILQSALTGTGAVVLGRLGASLASLGCWLALTHLICAAGALAFTPAQLRRSWWHAGWKENAAISLWDYARWAGLANVASAAFGSVDKLVVSAVLGPVAAGVYSIGTSIVDRLTQLTAPFSRVLVPFASSRLAAGERASVAPLFELACRWVACVLAAAGVVLLVWGDSLLGQWISPSFASEAGSMLRVLVVVYALFSAAAPGYQMALGFGEVKLLAALGVVGSVLSLVTIALGASRYGLVGAAFGNLPYLAVLGAPARVARFVGLAPWRVLVVDLGLPFIVLFPAAMLTREGLTARAWLTAALLGACVLFALQRGRRAAAMTILSG